MGLLKINWEPTRGKAPFVRGIPHQGRVLDVGCGNNSPEWFRQARPDLYYVGIDVGDYNHANDPSRFADEYIVCSPLEFAERIALFKGSMDAVVSHHNLEHCNDPDAVLSAMVSALKPGGKLYLAFPCEESVSFPKRGGCLNFYDDSSHNVIPSWTKTLKVLEDAECRLEFSAKRYRPFPLFWQGLFFEPVSMFRKHVLPHGATWALYGFESVIWAVAPEKKILLRNWGEQTTTRGKGVNMQPNGTSALWIEAANVCPFGDVYVHFGRHRADSPAMVRGDMTTTMIPESVIQTAGEYEVAIVESSGRRTPIGTFTVKP